MIDVCPRLSAPLQPRLHAPQYFVLLRSPSLRILFSVIAFMWSRIGGNNSGSLRMPPPTALVEESEDDAVANGTART
jgi:hypothetical protein